MVALHLAQISIAHPLALISYPFIADFVVLLDPINAFAESSLGFIWCDANRRQMAGSVLCTVEAQPRPAAAK
jgi:hypothetical protein